MLTSTMNWADIVCAEANSVYEARPTYPILGGKCGGYILADVVSVTFSFSLTNDNQPDFFVTRSALTLLRG